MSGRLNPQSPELKLKDSIKRARKIKERRCPPLSCYGEKYQSIVELRGTTQKKLKELPYMKRLGVAKWFKKHNKLSEYLIELLFIDVKHLDITQVEPINPVAKCYMSKEEYQKLIGKDSAIKNKKKSTSRLNRINDTASSLATSLQYY